MDLATLIHEHGSFCHTAHNVFTLLALTSPSDPNIRSWWNTPIHNLKRPICVLVQIPIDPATNEITVEYIKTAQHNLCSMQMEDWTEQAQHNTVSRKLASNSRR